MHAVECVPCAVFGVYMDIVSLHLSPSAEVATPNTSAETRKLVAAYIHGQGELCFVPSPLPVGDRE